MYISLFAWKVQENVLKTAINIYRVLAEDRIRDGLGTKQETIHYIEMFLSVAL